MKPENEKPAEWYDGKTGRGRAFFQSAFHKELYFEVANFLNPKDKIIDLGCGGGRLLQAFQKRNLIPKKYLGIDFSGARIEVAKSAYQNLKWATPWSFRIGDITKYSKDYNNFDTFVLVTVLEHINKDREVLDNIPSGCKIIMANPNKMCDSHVRKYESEEYIIDRYGDLLEFQDVKVLYNPDGSPRMFIHKCRRL